MANDLTDVLPGLSRGARSPARRRSRRVILAVILLSGLGSLAAWRGIAQRGATQAPPYETEVVSRGPLAISVTAVGALEPLRAVAVGSELSGVVREVLVDVNDVVAKGQPLAVLDRSILESQARLAAAQEAAARASVEQARIVRDARGIEAERALAAASALPQAEVDQAQAAAREAEAALRVARARLQEARAALASARMNLDKATIVAPIDGVILERNVEPGQAVVSALQAATLFQVAADLEHMTVVVDVDEADVGLVSPGAEADFTVAAWPDRLFEARVTKVHPAPVAGGSVVTYRAELAVDNPERLLLPGMTATARIQARRLEDALLVPNAALRFSPEGEELPAPEARDGRRRARVWASVGGELEPVEVIPLATDGVRTAVEGADLAAGAELAVAAGEPAKKRPSAGPPHP